MADSRKADLIRDLQRARSRAAANSQALSDDLHVGDKLKENIAQNRGAWISGAVLTGLVISKIPPRTRKVEVSVPRFGASKPEKAVEKAGLVGLGLALLKFVFNIVRPIALKWLTKRYLGPGTYRTGA